MEGGKFPAASGLEGADPQVEPAPAGSPCLKHQAPWNEGENGSQKNCKHCAAV